MMLGGALLGSSAALASQVNPYRIVLPFPPTVYAVTRAYFNWKSTEKYLKMRNAPQLSDTEVVLFTNFDGTAEDDIYAKYRILSLMTL